MEQPDQVSFTTEIGGSVKFLVGIANPFRTNTVNQKDPTIHPTTVQSNHTNGQWHSDQDYLHLSSLDSGTDVTTSVRNIDNRTGMKPQGPTVTKIPESNSAINRNVFDSVRRTSDITYRGLSWNDADKIENENLWGSNISKNVERENSFWSWESWAQKICNLE